MDSHEDGLIRCFTEASKEISKKVQVKNKVSDLKKKKKKKKSHNVVTEVDKQLLPSLFVFIKLFKECSFLKIMLCSFLRKVLCSF